MSSPRGPSSTFRKRTVLVPTHSSPAFTQAQDLVLIILVVYDCDVESTAFGNVFPALEIAFAVANEVDEKKQNVLRFAFDNEPAVNCIIINPSTRNSRASADVAGISNAMSFRSCEMLSAVNNWIRKFHIKR